MPQESQVMAIDWEHVDPLTSFKNITLTGENFSRRSLVGIDFSGSILHSCNFAQSDLSHANFHDADLYRSTFEGSVLYVTQFSRCNLTRCSFANSYLYGFQLAEPSNVTYTKFTKLQLEGQHRSSHMSSSAEGLPEFRPGQEIADVRDLCRSSYYANGLKFSFRPFRPRENEMQQSQVFNRLRRLYEANGFDEEARHCLYFERYFRTRSRYLFHTFPEELTGKGKRAGRVRRNVAWFSGYFFEYLAGYGLRPNVVLRNLLLVYFVYVLTVIVVLSSHSGSGIVYDTLIPSANGEIAAGPGHIVGAGYRDLPAVLYFCLFSMFSLTFQRFNPFGHLVWVSSVFGMIGLSLLALLITTVYSVLRSD